ncbi:hypothetical protein BT69DRAFT_1355069, partial [Atractiella rhizophila]
MSSSSSKPRGKKRSLHESSISSPTAQAAPKRALSSSLASLDGLVKPEKKLQGILRKDSSSSLGEKEAPGKGMERGLLLAFLDSALADKKQGKQERYREFVADLRSFSTPFNPSSSKSKLSKQLPTQKTLLSYLQVLPHVASQLDRSHEDLVAAILDLPWTIMDVEELEEKEIPKKLRGIPGAFVRCVGALCSAKSTLWVSKVLEKSVNGFRYDAFKSLRTAPNQLSLEEQESAPKPSRALHSMRLHYLLRHLIDLIPTISTAIVPYLEKSFPGKRSKRDEQVVYVENLLKLLEYCGGIEETVTEMVVVRAIKLDIELQIDLEDWEQDGAFDETPFFLPPDPFKRHLHSPSPSPPRSRSSSVSSFSTTSSSSLDLSDVDSDGDSALGDGGGGANEDEKEEKVEERKESLSTIRERVRTLDGVMAALLRFWEKRGEERPREVLMPFS